MKINELHNQPVQPDTYEASMALNQLLKIGKHAIKIHNMIDDRAEMESWVAKKIDLAGDYVKKVHGYMQGEKAGLYDDGGLTEDQTTIEVKAILDKHGIKSTDDIEYGSDAFSDLFDYFSSDPDEMPYGVQKARTGMPDEWIADRLIDLGLLKEDAGEGHMSKSTLYHTAKYAIELMQMINKGDDLEGWVQSKLNKAADYLQGVHNYEEYQKLNPYREELDQNVLQKHAQVVQKNIDEILARETKLDDVDTKPGMMRILAKRVNEVEKEMAKENRKNVKEQPSGIGRAIGTAARSLGAKAAGKLGMKKTAAGLQGRVNVDKKSAELDTALAQYLGTQRADKNRIEPKVLQGFLAQQGIDQKYMQYVKGPINQQQAGKLIDKISADGFAGQFQRPQPNVPGEKGQDQKVQQRATQLKNVVGAKGTSPAMTAKGIGALAKGDRPQPNQLKQIAPYAAQLQKIMADPKLAQRFRQLLQMANRQQTVTADVDESGIMYRAGVKKYGKEGMRKIQSAAGKGASHQEIGKIKDKYVKDDADMDLDEGKIKDWAKSLAMAGIFVAGLAGVGSIENAIDNQVPAVKAMNTAYEMAVDSNNDELAKMIKNDISAVKVRLHSGKDLNFVKSMQEKYSKFMQTEGLAYESKLAVLLNQRLK